MNNDLLISNIPLHISNMKKATRQFCENYMLFETNQNNLSILQSLIYEILQPPEEEELIKKIEETARKWELQEHTSTSTNWDFNHVLGKDRKSPGLMVPDEASCRTGRSSMFLRCSTRSTSAKRRWGHYTILSCCHLYPGQIRYVLSFWSSDDFN